MIKIYYSNIKILKGGLVININIYLSINYPDKNLLNLLSDKCLTSHCHAIYKKRPPSLAKFRCIKSLFLNFTQHSFIPILHYSNLYILRALRGLNGYITLCSRPVKILPYLISSILLVCVKSSVMIL